MKFIILGCGSSMGVPRADGFFGKCNPNNKKNYRSRCSALLKLNDMNILIDTSPELRTQLIKNDIKKIDKVLYSHMHADQTPGINDLRIFYIKLLVIVLKVFQKSILLFYHSIQLKKYLILKKKNKKLILDL